jgi:hypothetical protein
MIWYDIWCDVTWYMIWYDVMIWYDIRYDVMWCDMIWYDMMYDMMWCDMIRYDMMYLLTAIGLPPGDSSREHIYTQTIHRTTQNKQYVEQHKNFRENQNIFFIQYFFSKILPIMR